MHLYVCGHVISGARHVVSMMVLLYSEAGRQMTTVMLLFSQAENNDYFTGDRSKNATTRICLHSDATHSPASNKIRSYIIFFECLQLTAENDNASKLVYVF